MYAKRNSLTLGALLIVVLVVGGTLYYKNNKELDRVSERNQVLSKQFYGTNKVAATLESVEARYKELKTEWDKAPKKILALDEPALTVSYINWLINNHRLDLGLDFVLNELNKVPEISSFNFTVSGEGRYHDIYQFIWYLTQNPLLYQIKSFKLTRKNKEERLLGFHIQIIGYFMTQKWELQQKFDFASIDPMSDDQDFFDIFKGRVNLIKRTSQPTKPTPSIRPKVKPKPKVDDSLIDINNVALSAIANDRAYFKASGGKLITLKIGDRVKGGHFDSIDAKKSQAIFTVAGKKVILGLGYRK
jgi:Tfp pilus assembly protein PilO